MKNLTFALILVLICLAACNPAEPAATLAPTAAPPQPTSTSSPPPDPTAPAQAEQPAAPNPLALYAPAMRPAFVDDLTAVGPLSQYRLEVTVSPEQATVSGRETVRYLNAEPVSLDAIYFRLFPNLPGYGGDLKVSEVRIGGQAVASSLERERTALHVPLPTPLLPGKVVTIELDFSVQVPQTAGEGYGQFIFQEEIMALANFFPLIPAYNEENCARFGNCDGGWNTEVAVPYGDAVYSDSALFEVLVSAPAGWTVAASGSTLGQETNPEGDVTWHLVSGPMRDFNLVLSPRFEVETQMVEDITVNSYYLPADAAGGQLALGWAADALAFFNQRFGPYPFAEFDIVETPNVAGGIEYPGLIAMPIHNYDQTGDFFQWATVHEVGHQWWYSLVGNDQQDEPWLDEALVQYSTALFYEFHIGWEAAVEEIFEARYHKVAGTEEDDWISRPVADYTDENYGPIVYSKGPLFFHALRQEVGDETLFAILETYYSAHRYHIASGRDLLAVIDQVAGRDMSDLYQTWLWQAGDDGG